MLLGTKFLTPFAILDQLLGVLQSSPPEEIMAEGFGDKRSGSRVVATLALVDIFEDCLALLRLHAALVHTSDTVPHKFSVDNGVRCRPTLHLSGRDLISWQLFIYQKVEDGLRP